MKGKFIGTNSMGFINREVYDLKSEIKTIVKHGKPIACICLYDKFSPARCPYSSLETVLQNWNFNFENNKIKPLNSK